MFEDIRYDENGDKLPTKSIKITIPIRELDEKEARTRLKKLRTQYKEEIEYNEKKKRIK